MKNNKVVLFIVVLVILLVVLVGYARRTQYLPTTQTLTEDQLDQDVQDDVSDLNDSSLSDQQLGL